jgi:hypothetical protein
MYYVQKKNTLAWFSVVQKQTLIYQIVNNKNLRSLFGMCTYHWLIVTFVKKSSIEKSQELGHIRKIDRSCVLQKSICFLFYSQKPSNICKQSNNQTCIKRSPRGQRKSGLIGQVNSYEIFYDRTRKRWPFILI